MQFPSRFLTNQARILYTWPQSAHLLPDCSTHSYEAYWHSSLDRPPGFSSACLRSRSRFLLMGCFCTSASLREIVIPPACLRVSCNNLHTWVLLVCASLQDHQSSFCLTACLLLPGQSTALHAHLLQVPLFPWTQVPPALDGTVATLRILTCKCWHFPLATPTCPYQTTWFTQHHLQANECFQKDCFLLFEIDVQKKNTTSGQMKQYKPCLAFLQMKTFRGN